MENVGESESIEQYNAEAPLVGGIRFDPQRVKDRHNGKLITLGISGKQIPIRVESNYIAIGSLISSDIHFEATLKENKEKKAFIKFDIRTKKLRTETKDPDFYAQKLADAAIEYFGKKNNIYAIRFMWQIDNESDNYKKYIELKNQFLAELSKTQTNSEQAEAEARKRAAFGTWTGEKIAKRHNFTSGVVVEEITIRKDRKYPYSVKGYFYKNP